jgi:hypothetical protein
MLWAHGMGFLRGQVVFFFFFFVFAGNVDRMVLINRIVRLPTRGSGDLIPWDAQL